MDSGRVVVARAVIDAWRRQRGAAGASLALHVRHPDPAAVTHVVSTVCEQAMAQLASEPGSGGGEREGTVSVCEVPGGVMIMLVQPASFEALLELIVSGLERAAVSATIAVMPTAPRAWSWDKRDSDYFECRLRLRGRVDPQRTLRWISDQHAVDAAQHAAVAWCAEPTQVDRIVISAGWQLRFDVDDADVAKYLQIAADVTRLTSYASVFRLVGPRWRGAVLDQVSGRLTLMEGGSDLRDGGWRAPLAALRSELSRAACWASYGFVKRGECPDSATNGNSLGGDWSGVNRVVASDYSSALESVLLPDVFGLQLLGAGHGAISAAGKLSGWRIVDLPCDAKLLESDDRDAWFAERWPATSILPIARTALAPALMTESMILARLSGASSSSSRG